MKSLYALILLCTLSFSAQAAPQFKDYPVAVFSGSSHPAVLNKETRAFKTRVIEAAKSPANFAGSYVVDSFGCGTECVVHFYVDKKTGATSFLPEDLRLDFSDATCENDMYYKPNSRLLVESLRLNGRCSVVYYEFVNGQFKFLEAQPFAEGVQ